MSRAKMRTSSANHLSFYYTIAPFFTACFSGTTVGVVFFLKLTFFTEDISIIRH